jgi:hypothetical protein
MTKPLITLPCTARELENALHAACDHYGLWDAKIRPVLVKPQGGYFLEFYDLETEGKGEAK